MKRQNLYIGLGWLLILLSGGLLLYLGWLRNYLHIGGENPVENWADWSGGLTAPLLSIAGYFFIYAAFRQQSRDSQEGQKRFLLQQFETTFFNLISLHNQNVSDIHQTTSKHVENFFALAHSFLESQSSKDTSLAYVSRLYEQQFYAKHYNHIDHFARHLLFVLTFIDETSALGDTEKGKAEKQRFVNILLAQLSTDELFLLFYHCMSMPDVLQQYREVLKRYHVFGRLFQAKVLLDAQHQVAFEGPKAPQSA